MDVKFSFNAMDTTYINTEHCNMEMSIIFGDNHKLRYYRRADYGALHTAGAIIGHNTSASKTFQARHDENISSQNASSDLFLKS